MEVVRGDDAKRRRSGKIWDGPDPKADITVDRPLRPTGQRNGFLGPTSKTIHFRATRRDTGPSGFRKSKTQV